MEKVNTHTTQLPQPSSKLIPLFEHPLAPLFNKRVELDRERVHALAQVFEVEVDAWKLRERVVRVRGRLWAILRCAEGGGAGREIRRRDSCRHWFSVLEIAGGVEMVCGLV